MSSEDPTLPPDGSVAPQCSATAEFTELLPPEAEFAVRFNTQAGRYMVAAKTLSAGSEFLIETPLVAWPLVSHVLDTGTGPVVGWAAEKSRWCERCFCELSGKTSTPPSPSPLGISEHKTAPPAAVSGGSLKKRPAAACEPNVRKRPSLAREKAGNVAGDPPMLCSECAPKSRSLTSFVTQSLLWQWRRWQAVKSPNSCVGLEAFGRCFAQAAATTEVIRRAHGAEPRRALELALRPFERLAAPPDGSSVALHGTSAADVAAELKASEHFRRAIEGAVGCSEVADELLSASSVDALAGRLVLNAAGILLQVAGPGGALRGAGIFVLLSLMNHACAPSAEAVFLSSNEVSLRTTREVEAGEALTLSYVPTEWPAEARQTRLKHWFFDCDCWLCSTELSVKRALESQ